MLKLSSLENHGSIGFDVDHCLVRYKIKALTRVCYLALAQTLVLEKGYGAELLNLTDQETGIGLNYSILDV